MFSLVKFLIGLAILIVALGVWRTWQAEHEENQKLFVAGTVPEPKPDGLYRGEVPGHTFSWIGKKFNAASSTGINVFDDGGGVQGERYPFVTSVGKGIRDKDIDVMKIDYDIPANPFWLRFILDEIVQTAPGEYLGKLQLKLVPGYPFTLGYFTLKK